MEETSTTEDFKDKVAAHKIKGESPKGGSAQPIGLALMVIGTAGSFVLYAASLGQSDSRNILSFQIMALGFVSLTVIGAAMFITGSLARLLRLWLLRQLMEQHHQSDQLRAVLGERELV